MVAGSQGFQNEELGVSELEGIWSHVVYPPLFLGPSFEITVHTSWIRESQPVF
jgi:hypothetical protein